MPAPKESPAISTLRSQIDGLMSLKAEKVADQGKVTTNSESPGTDNKSPFEKLMKGDVLGAATGVAENMINSVIKLFSKLIDSLFGGKEYAAIKEKYADASIGDIEGQIADLESQIKVEKDKEGENQKGDGSKSKDKYSMSNAESGMDNAKSEARVVIEGLEGETSTYPESAEKLPPNNEKQDTKASRC